MDQDVLRLPGHERMSGTATSPLESDHVDGTRSVDILPDLDVPMAPLTSPPLNRSGVASQSSSSGSFAANITQLPVLPPLEVSLPTLDHSAPDSDNSFSSAAVSPSPRVSSDGSLTSDSGPDGVSSPCSTMVPTAASTPAHHDGSPDATLVRCGEPVDEPNEVSVVDGGRNVSISSPDQTFLGFTYDSEVPMPSSESSDYLSAVDSTLSSGTVAAARDSGAPYYSAASDADPTDDHSSGDLYSPSASEVSSGSPPERPSFPGRLQRHSQRVRPRRTVLTYESLGKPQVTEYKLPRR